MSKESLVNAVAEQTGITKTLAREAVDAVFSQLSNDLTRSGTVRVAGFGTFEVRKRPERPGRNPATGETIQLPESKSVGFRAGAALKSQL